MKATIAQKTEIAKDTLLVRFDLYGQTVDFKPGQHFMIHLLNAPFNDAKGLNRHFSIVNSPNQTGILEMATRLRDSAFKKSLQELPVGSEVEISGIDGSFVLPEDTQRPLVFIAGGIGITPFISMLRFISDKRSSHKITLLYSNRDQQSTPFLAELQKIAQSASWRTNFKLVLTMTEDPSWEGEKRMITAEFVKNYLDKVNEYTYYMAGPPPMVDAVYNELLSAGIEDKNIVTENFTGY